jgi:hypothetical protein
MNLGWMGVKVESLKVLFNNIVSWEDYVASVIDE